MTNYWNNNIFKRGVYMDTLLNEPYEYQQRMQQLQNKITTEGCCISKPNVFQMGADYRYLSDIIKSFGDLGIQSLTENHEYGCISTLTIETNMYAKRPENIVKEKENNEMNNSNMSNNSMFDAFKGMFGKVDNGMCRLSMNGNIAVKTSNGYKSYNMKEGRLVNCANFVFPMGDEMFFIIPTNKVEQGDIIIVAGLPKCVLKKDVGTITVINYEDSTVETILPERHIFMGETYFYGKVVSMFGEDIIGGGKKSMNKIMKFMMMSEMMKGFGGNSQNNAMANLMPFMMMSGGNMGDLFSGIFDFGDKEEEYTNDHIPFEDEVYKDIKRNGDSNKRTESKDTSD